MNWFQQNWSGLCCRVTGLGAPIDDETAKVRLRDKLTAQMRARYGISKEEADRCVSEWIKDPGVLDDWNDTRSILDM